MFPRCYPADFFSGNFIPNWAMFLVLELEEYLMRTGDRAFIENAKTSRPSVCNAAEVCLVHRDIAEEFLPKLAGLLTNRAVPVELRTDERAYAIVGGTPAGEAD